MPERDYKLRFLTSADAKGIDAMIEGQKHIREEAQKTNEVLQAQGSGGATGDLAAAKNSIEQLFQKRQEAIDAMKGAGSAAQDVDLGGLTEDARALSSVLGGGGLAGSLTELIGKFGLVGVAAWTVGEAVKAASGDNSDMEKVISTVLFPALDAQIEREKALNEIYRDMPSAGSKAKTVLEEIAEAHRKAAENAKAQKEAEDAANRVAGAQDAADATTRKIEREQTLDKIRKDGSIDEETRIKRLRDQQNLYDEEDAGFAKDKIQRDAEAKQSALEHANAKKQRADETLKKLEEEQRAQKQILQFGRDEQAEQARIEEARKNALLKQRVEAAALASNPLMLPFAAKRLLDGAGDDPEVKAEHEKLDAIRDARRKFDEENKDLLSQKNYDPQKQDQAIEAAKKKAEEAANAQRSAQTQAEAAGQESEAKAREADERARAQQERRNKDADDQIAKTKDQRTKVESDARKASADSHQIEQDDLDATEEADRKVLEKRQQRLRNAQAASKEDEAAEKEAMSRDKERAARTNEAFNDFLDDWGKESGYNDEKRSKAAKDGAERRSTERRSREDREDADIEARHREAVRRIRQRQDEGVIVQQQGQQTADQQRAEQERRKVAQDAERRDRQAKDDRERNLAETWKPMEFAGQLGNVDGRKIQADYREANDALTQALLANHGQMTGDMIGLAGTLRIFDSARRREMDMVNRNAHFLGLNLGELTADG